MSSPQKDAANTNVPPREGEGHRGGDGSTSNEQRATGVAQPPSAGNTGGGACATVAPNTGEGACATVPVWQEISGLTVEAEGKMTRSERRYALRKLFRHYEKLVREALEEHEKDPEKEERTFLWDPVPMLCIELGISRRKLSALTRELTGMAAHEVVDRVRAEKVVTRMEDNIAEILNQWYTPGGDHRIKGSWWGDDLREAVREQRREDGFDGCAWALLHGFP
ncbi:MAG TPA: hypothetical protein VGP72_11175, partial [Planctomycetota bacterium]